MQRAVSSSVVASEVLRFDAQMRDWWNPQGPGKALHQLNPVRSLFVRRFVCGVMGLPQGVSEPLKGLQVLDMGCGGGLLSEALARLGGRVTGVDASHVAIQVATEHAKQSGLDHMITYEQGTAETITPRDPYDLVVCSEVMEHVADPAQLVGHLASLSKGGKVGCVVR